jgi:MFS family permease
LLSPIQPPNRRAPRLRAELRIVGRALGNPAYRRFTLSNLVSVTGTWMQVVAQNWLVFHLTGSAAPVGVTVMLQSIPSVVLGVWGGALADRVSKRTILLVTQPLLGLLAIGLGVMSAVGVVTVPVLYAFALLLGVVTAVDGPAHGAFGAELVDECELGNAVALGSVCNSTGRIVGMALGGLLVATMGAASVFLLNGISYFAVVGALATLPSHWHEPTPESDRAVGVRDAVEFVRSTPALLAALAMAALVSALGRNFQVTMAAMSGEAFGAGASGYATLSTVFALGALLGGAVAARLRRHDVSVMVAVAAVTGLGQMAAGAMPTFLSFAVSIAGLAAGAVMFDTVASTLIQAEAGAARRGRLVALLAAVSMAGAAIGAPLLGWLSDQVGPRTALEPGGVAVAAGALAVVRRGRRRSPSTELPALAGTGAG